MIYRKRGTTARWENGTFIRVNESGVAIEESEVFECRPEGERRRGGIEPVELEQPRVQLPANVKLERLIASRGIAIHQYNGKEWREEAHRLHLSLTRAHLRILIDQAHFDTTEIERIAHAFGTSETVEREAPPRLRLAPNVTAALLPALVGIAPPNVRLLQTAGGVDGYGEEIVEAERDWPNVYRPSYRIRPMRVPINLRLACDVTHLDEDRPRAIALLAPVRSTTINVLIEDMARLYPSTVRITRIDAVADERVWYPYGAGSFGAEMML
jgi:hypothetical protein